MANETYIKVYRKVLDNPLFMEAPFDKWHAFEYLLLKAYRFPKDIIIKGQKIHLEAGQYIMGQRKMSEVFGWSRGKTIRFQKWLEREHMASFNGTTYGASIGTLITIENYSKYQRGDNADSTTNSTTDSTTGSTTGSTTDSTNIKKGNKGNKGKKDIYMHIPPTRQQVQDYCTEKGYSIDVNRFMDFYESKGWMVGKNKMKDWRAAVRNWERNEEKRASAQTGAKSQKDYFDMVDNWTVESMEREKRKNGGSGK